MRKGIKFIDLILHPAWIVGLAGSGIFITMLIPKCSSCNQLILGMLVGIISTIIAFGMSFMNLKEE